MVLVPCERLCFPVLLCLYLVRSQPLPELSSGTILHTGKFSNPLAFPNAYRVHLDSRVRRRGYQSETWSGKLSPGRGFPKLVMVALHLGDLHKQVGTKRMRVWERVVAVIVVRAIGIAQSGNVGSEGSLFGIRRG